MYRDRQMERHGTEIQANRVIQDTWKDKQHGAIKRYGHSRKKGGKHQTIG